MKALLVLMFAVSLAMQANIAAARQGGVFTKLRQLPVVQRATEVWQGTSRDLATRIVAISILTASFCTIAGCGDEDRGYGEIEEITSEAILNSESSHEYIGQNIYLLSADGEPYLGYVLGSGYLGNRNSYYHLVKLMDGTEDIVSDERVGGVMIVGSPDIGLPVKIIGDRTDEIMTGIISSVYGVEKEQYSRHGTSYWELVAELYIVKLDSGEERFVPASSIVAWLNVSNW